MTYKEIKKDIIDTINLPLQAEPYFMVGEKYDTLTNQSDKDIYLHVIKELIVHENIQYRFAGLVALEIMHKELDCKEEIKYCVDNFNPEKEIKLVTRLLSACAVISEDWAINFIRKILHEFKFANNKKHIYEQAINSASLSLHWKELMNEINFAITAYDNITFNDFIAFFKYIRGEKDYKEFKEMLTAENLNRLTIQKHYIEKRYKIYKR